jgi:hypothetical protein
VEATLLRPPGTKAACPVVEATLLRTPGTTAACPVVEATLLRTPGTRAACPVVEATLLRPPGTREACPVVEATLLRPPGTTAACPVVEATLLRPPGTTAACPVVEATLLRTPGTTAACPVVEATLLSPLINSVPVVVVALTRTVKVTGLVVWRTVTMIFTLPKNLLVAALTVLIEVNGTHAPLVRENVLTTLMSTAKVIGLSVMNLVSLTSLYGRSPLVMVLTVLTEELLPIVLLAKVCVVMMVTMMIMIGIQTDLLTLMLNLSPCMNPVILTVMHRITPTITSTPLLCPSKSMAYPTLTLTVALPSWL